MKALAEKDREQRGPTQRRRSSRERDGAPASPGHARANSAAPLQAALDRSARVSAQSELRASLDRSPRVVAETQRGAVLGARAVQRRATTGPVVQRALNRTGRRVVRGGTTLGGALGLGYALSGFGLPGIIGGGLVGGLTGYLAPDLVRWARAGNIWTEVNNDDPRHRSWNTPANLADQLTRDSSEFRSLREKAVHSVRSVHNRSLSYESADDNIGGHSAAYGKGVVRIDEEQSSPAVSVQNLVFETANAAQSEFFDQLRADYENGAMTGRTLQHYGNLLGRDPKELGKLADEYTSADLRARRGLLQEWGEWASLELARKTFQQISPRFKSEAAQWQWDEGFGQRLSAKDFSDYYERFGHSHRKSVERGGWGENENKDKKDL